MEGNLLIRPLSFDLEAQTLNILDTKEYFIRLKVDDYPVKDSLKEHISEQNPVFKETSGIRIKGNE
jgi:hypothetical protein